MSRRAAVYDDLGKILEVRTAPDRYLEETMDGYLWIEVFDDSIDDVNSFVDVSGDTPIIRDRVPIEIEIIKEELKLTILGAPLGSVVEVSGLKAESDEEGMEIEFDHPGTYSVEITPPPQYMEETLEVTVG